MAAPALYLDECLDHRLTASLRAAGYEVVSVSEVATISNDDRSQLLYATAQGRVLMTQNQIDFRRLHATFRTEGRHHAGIMLVPQTVPFPRLEQRVRLMVDWVATFETHVSQLFTWAALQQLIIHGFRLPGWDEPTVRQAVGWNT